MWELDVFTQQHPTKKNIECRSCQKKQIPKSTITKKIKKIQTRQNVIVIITITRISKFTINIQIHHFKITFMCPRSIAGVKFNSVGSLRTRITQRSRQKKRKSGKQKLRTKQAKKNPEQTPNKTHAKRRV